MANEEKDYAEYDTHLSSTNPKKSMEGSNTMIIALLEAITNITIQGGIVLDFQLDIHYQMPDSIEITYEIPEGIDPEDLDKEFDESDFK